MLFQSEVVRRQALAAHAHICHDNSLLIWLQLLNLCLHGEKMVIALLGMKYGGLFYSRRPYARNLVNFLAEAVDRTLLFIVLEVDPEICLPLPVTLMSRSHQTIEFIGIVIRELYFVLE
jgi:hypothetical protein